MYPFRSGQAFVRDRWYIAAFANEVTRDPIERTILGEPVALYRREDGRPVAMYGLCPHRYFPLAKGRLEGDAIVCGYHGFAFDAGGKCVRIPAQNAGAAFVQPTYPIEERGPLAWIWLGDKRAANPDLIPPYEDFGLAQPGWAHAAPSYFHLKGRAQLLIDNLMDLTHLPFVHSHLPGGAAHLTTDIEHEQRERSYRVVKRTTYTWNATGDLMYGPENRFEGIADRLSLTDFYGPELVRTSAPIITRLHSGAPVPAGVGELYFIHGATPETERTTHYFGLVTRNFRVGDAALDEMLLGHDAKVRVQDVEAIGLVEARLDQAAARQKELVAVTDRGALKVRSLIQAMLDRETTHA